MQGSTTSGVTGSEDPQIQRELKKIRKQVQEIETILQKLYEDHALSRIAESRYQGMSERYDTAQGELQAKQRNLEEAIAKTEEVFSNIENFTHLITRYTNIEQLDTRILIELIDRIEVHEKVIEPDGQKSQRVDIYYKFIGYIPMEPEGIEEFEEIW